MSNDGITRIALDESMVLEWLKHHPDLLARHPQLLADLTIPDQNSGSAASLIEKQVVVLRQKLESMEHRFESMVSTARENEALQERLHRISLAVTSAASYDAAISNIPHLLRREFEIDHVSILFSAEQLADSTHAEGWTLLHDRISHGKSVCDDRLPARVLEMLFGDQASSIASCALLPLPQTNGDVPGKGVHGVIGLGSGDRDRFNHDMGTIYLDRLGELVSTGLRRLKQNVRAA